MNKIDHNEPIAEQTTIAKQTTIATAIKTSGVIINNLKFKK